MKKRFRDLAEKSRLKKLEAIRTSEANNETTEMVPLGHVAKVKTPINVSDVIELYRVLVLSKCTGMFLKY